MTWNTVVYAATQVCKILMPNLLIPACQLHAHISRLIIMVTKRRKTGHTFTFLLCMKRNSNSINYKVLTGIRMLPTSPETRSPPLRSLTTDSTSSVFSPSDQDKSLQFLKNTPLEPLETDPISQLVVMFACQVSYLSAWSLIRSVACKIGHLSGRLLLTSVACKVGHSSGWLLVMLVACKVSRSSGRLLVRPVTRQVDCL